MPMSWLALIESVGEEGLAVATEGPVAGSERLEVGIELVEGAAMPGPTGGGGVIALFP